MPVDVVPTGRRVFLVLLALTAVLVAAPRAHARPAFGVQGGSAWSSQAVMDKDLGRIAATGAKLVRIQAYWAGLEPTQGAYDPATLAGLDRLVATAHKHRLKVVLFADGTPCWASSAPANLREACQGGNTPERVYRYPPADPQSFVPVSTFLVKRYAQDLAAYEVWNEPDQANERYWAGPDKVKRYVALMKAVYGPVKAAAPKVPVIAGSFVGTNGAWLQAMYDAGAKGFYDGLSVHFYDVPLYGLRNTRTVQRKNHDSKPMWLAEYGWSSCWTKGGPAVKSSHPCMTTSGQAMATKDLVRAIRKTSWIKAAVLYRLYDEDADYRFGLFDAKGHVKPLYTSFRQIVKATRTPARLPRPTLRLAVRKGRLVASGTASVTDFYGLTIKVGGQLRFRATLRTDRFGHFTLKAPAVIGTANASARLRAQWGGPTASARG